MNTVWRTVVALAAAVVLMSCGKSSDQIDAVSPADRGQRLPLAAEEKLVEKRRLVSARDLEKVSRRSVQRAFYDYWSAIENEEWSIALRHYPPETQRRLKPETLVVALRIEAQTPLVKPLIRSVRTTGRDQTSVRYYVRGGDGALRPTSMTWLRRDGRWYIAYCSTLDDSYGAAVQQEVQNTVDPTAKSPSKEALKAAARARRAQAAALRP